MSDREAAIGTDLPGPPGVSTLVSDQAEARAARRQCARSPGRERRRHVRVPFRTRCVVRYFQPGTHKILTVEGRTRDVSRAGVGLSLGCALRPGEPIELEIRRTRLPVMFLAGTVAYCRAVRGKYAVGVRLLAAGDGPIFSQAPAVAVRTLPWLREALHQD